MDPCYSSKRFQFLLFSLPLLILALAAGPVAGQTFTDAKLVVHLVSTGPGGCGRGPTSLACNGNSTVVTSGNLDTEYFAFIVAVNVNTQTQLLGVDFGIYYHASNQTGLAIYAWNSCAPFETPGATWPGPGSSIQLGFQTCQGGTADPADPDGRALVVLGYFYLSASSVDQLYITPRYDQNHGPITMRSCASTTYYIDRTSVGSAGFGGGGYDPCSTIADTFPLACCLEGGCELWEGLYCDYLGGYIVTPYSFVCEDILCTVPSVPTTWGRIKATYE